MKSITNLLLLTVTVLAANVSLAQPTKEIVKDFLDENVLIVVPVATNRGGVNPRLCVKIPRCCPAASTVGFHPIAGEPLSGPCSTHETKVVFPASKSKTARRNVFGTEAGLNREKASK